MRMAWLLVGVMAFGMSFAGAAEESPGADMPPALFHKLKVHFEAMYGSKAGTLPGVIPVDRTDAEGALRKDAAANKAALIQALGSSKSLHREYAARALEYCGDKPAAIEALSKILTADADESVRRAAGASLAKLPDAAAVDALLKGIVDPADAVRNISVIALGNIKDSRASEPLLKVLSADSKPTIRQQAAMALAKIKDANTMPALEKALQAESDERVKMAIAGAMRQLMGGSNTAQTEPIPQADDAAKELADLADQMKKVETKLRDDRHDQAVQVEGTAIEQKLSKLIEKLDKQCNGSCNKPGDPKEQKQAQQPGKKDGDNKNAGSPLMQSRLAGHVPQGSMNQAQVAGKQDAWAKLPPALRDKMQQDFPPDVPERWRKRLEAYFLSVASEEAKSMSEIK